MICYLICSGPRAGSHFLANLLDSTGVAGRPDDYFNPLGAARLTPQTADPIRYERAYVDDLVAETSTPNSVFGAMVQFNQAANHIGFNRLASLFPAAPRFIFLTRNDETRQAVSLAIARQTGQFFATQAAQRAPVYNADQIRCCLEDVRNHNRGWETYFWEHRIQPHRICYEECVVDPVSTIESTLRFIGGLTLSTTAERATSSVQRQGTEVNDRWTSLYLQNPRQ